MGVFLLRVRGAFFFCCGCAARFFAAGAQCDFLLRECAARFVERCFLLRACTRRVFFCAGAERVFFLAAGARRVFFAAGARRFFLLRVRGAFFFLLRVRGAFFLLRVRGAFFFLLRVRGAFFFCCGCAARFLLRVRRASKTP